MYMCYSRCLFFIEPTKVPILKVHGLEKSNIICNGYCPYSWTIRLTICNTIFFQLIIYTWLIASSVKGCQYRMPMYTFAGKSLCSRASPKAFACKKTLQISYHWSGN